MFGDGESWSRQSVDFAGLPEMARTFLQVAAGAANIPVTRLLGQSPSGLSSTGESDIRNYYDMIAERQELDLRPQLERLDRLICWSEDIDERALTFAFRPLWQLDEPAKAALALSRAQATQVYAGLKLWPDAVMARLAEAQLVADGIYPNAAAVFAEENPDPSAARSILDDNYDPDQPRDENGRWTAGGSGAGRETEVHPLPGTSQTGAATSGSVAGPPGTGLQTQSSEDPADLAHESPQERLTAILGPPEDDPAKIHLALQEHVVKGQVAPTLGSPRLVAAALAFLAYRALQSALEGTARNISSWFRTAPPPDPKGSGPPPSEPHDDPPPLTIHGPRGSSGPPGLAPAGPAPTSPPSQEPEAPLPLLPPSRPAEPSTEKPAGPPPTSADPTQPPGYVFSEKAEDPAPATPDRELPRIDPRAAQKLDNALSDYDTRRCDIGNQVFQLDKAGMRHILERHAPEYWDGSSKGSQTFFEPGMSFEEIQNAVRDVLGQNQDAIIAEPSAYEWKLSGTSGGRRYTISTYQGRIIQVYPSP